MNDYLSSYKTHRKITTLVENRTTYNSNFAELNIFETRQFTEKLVFQFNSPIIASMLTGKKTIHLNSMPSFEFIPGESLVIPSNEIVEIDLPIATELEPTQCLTLTLDTEKINEIASNFNQAVAIEDENNNWSLDKMSSHLKNQVEVDLLIKRLVTTFTNDCKSKDFLVDLMIQELVVRLLQTKARQSILEDTSTIFCDTRIGTVIKFINEHLTDKNITVDVLAKKAYMSASNFHKQFKNTLGISPIDYVNSERIKFSKKLISDGQKRSISDIAFKSGFNSLSYFNRQFKKYELVAPSQYRKIIK